MKLCTVIEHRA